MDPIEIKNLLQSKKIAKRKSAVKAVTKDNILESGDAVFALLLSELETKKSWEFIVSLP